MRAWTPLVDALTMGLLNLCATVVLVMLHSINASYNWPNPFVTVAAPLAAAVFLVVTAVWFLESVRRARARVWISGSVKPQRIQLRQSRPVVLARHLEPESWRRFARGALDR